MPQISPTIRSKIEEALVKHNRAMTIQEVAKETDLPPRVIGRNMAELSGRRILKRVGDSTYELAPPSGDMKIETLDPEIPEDAFRVVPSVVPPIRRSGRKGSIFEVVEQLPSGDMLIKDEHDNFYKAEKVEVSRKLVIKTKSGEETIIR